MNDSFDKVELAQQHTTHLIGALELKMNGHVELSREIHAEHGRRLESLEDRTS